MDQFEFSIEAKLKQFDGQVNIRKTSVNNMTNKAMNMMAQKQNTILK